MKPYLCLIVLAAGAALAQSPEKSALPAEVLVNGATGGVASLAIDMLAGRGYRVAALTGKDAEHEFLKTIGAAEVLSRHKLEMGTRPLEKTLWAAAFDSVGGESLAWLRKQIA